MGYTGVEDKGKGSASHAKRHAHRQGLQSTHTASDARQECPRQTRPLVMGTRPPDRRALQLIFWGGGGGVGTGTGKRPHRGSPFCF